MYKVTALAIYVHFLDPVFSNRTLRPVLVRGRRNYTPGLASSCPAVRIRLLSLLLTPPEALAYECWAHRPTHYFRDFLAPTV
ncbi:hypothetical protein JB92DRAFT_2978015 [Gautieria morchelliformis]|nr:hypothetical protein JB92DRAFT_2978015 [Gautieria morchelliformis]